MSKDWNDMTYDEVVNAGVERVLEELLTGNFRRGVRTAMDYSASWARAQEAQEARRPSKRQARKIKHCEHAGCDKNAVEGSLCQVHIDWWREQQETSHDNQ